MKSQALPQPGAFSMPTIQATFAVGSRAIEPSYSLLPCVATLFHLRARALSALQYSVTCLRRRCQSGREVIAVNSNYVSKRTAGDMLQSFRLLWASGRLTRR